MSSSSWVVVAKTVRNELKRYGIKARVRSSGKGGTSVDIDIVDALPKTIDMIEEFVLKYKYNGKNPDEPKVRFIFVNNTYSAEMKQKAWDYIRENHNDGGELPSSYNECGNIHVEGFYGDTFVYMVLRGTRGMSFWRSHKKVVRV